MTDIAPGDVIEAIRDIRRRFGNGPLLDIAINRGSRYVVLAIVSRNSGCSYCEGTVYLDIGLDGPTCPCGWRKIGGSKSDTIRKFAEDLNTKPPANTPSKREKV